MISLGMLIVSMSLQAVLIIGVVFGIRKLFALAHISKKYVMLLWIIPFFFLIFPWKIAVPRGFWSSAATEFTAGLGGMDAADVKKAFQDADFKSDSQQGQISEDLWESENEQKMQEMQNRFRTEKAQEPEEMLDPRKFVGSVQEDLLTAGEEGNRIIFGVLSAAWAAGMLFFLLRGAVSYRRVRRKVLCSRHSRECMQATQHAAV